MKKIIICMAMLFTLSANAFPPSMKETVTQKFKSAFTEAQNVKWFDGEVYYLVTFEEKDFTCKMFYDLNGNVFDTYRYYSDAIKLCPFIASKLLEKYKNRSIIGVTEIHTTSSLVYEVVLQDEINRYIVNCDSEGNMHLINKFKKN